MSILRIRYLDKKVVLENKLKCTLITPDMKADGFHEGQ